MDNNPFEQLEKHMRALKGLGNQMETLDKMWDGNKSFWEVAIESKDGKSEAEYRAKLHTLLDQKLDLQARALQLAKEFQP